MKNTKIRTERAAGVTAACIRLAAMAAIVTAVASSPADAQVGYERAEHYGEDAIGIDVWTERGPDYVYGYEESASVSFRASDDAYVVVYGTDAYGAVHLLYPTRPDQRRRLHGGRVYTIDAYDLHTAGVEGIVHVEALACAYPLEPHLPAFFHTRGPRYRPHRVGHSPDLVLRLGFVIGDPYLGFASLRGAIVPRGCAPRYVGYATLSYSIGAHRYYPRYVCNDCHYGGWYDPYHDSCSVFEIRIDSFWTNVYPHYDRCQPRYYYWKRASVPVRYRHYKTKWSSKDQSADMVRFFSGKSTRERDHLDTRTKPTLVSGRGGRDAAIDPKGVRDGRDGRDAVVRGERERPEDARAKSAADRGGRAEVRDRDDHVGPKTEPSRGDRPKPEAKPSGDERPKPKAKPSSGDERPKPKAKPSSGDRPKPKAKPRADDRPKPKAKPKSNDRPSREKEKPSRDDRSKQKQTPKGGDRPRR